MKKFKISYGSLIILIIFLFLQLFYCSDLNKNTNINDNDNNTPVNDEPTDETNEDFIYENSSIKEFEQEILGKLTGVLEIEPGIKISERHSLNSRIIVNQYLSETLENLEYTPQSHLFRYIYAVLESTEESDEYVVLGAHHDSINDECPGADDNASGVALVMAVARSMKGIARRNINLMFVFFDEEEKGGIGSNFFAKKLKNEGVKIHSMHNFDMVGWDEDGDRAIEIDKQFSQNIYQIYYDASDISGLNVPIYLVAGGGSDHITFRLHGFKALGIFEECYNGDTTPHYHKPTDTYDTINFDYLLSTTLLVIEAMKILLKQ